MLTILQLAVEVARHEAERNGSFAAAAEHGNPTEFQMYVWPSYGYGRTVEAWSAARVLNTVDVWTV